ncbi:MAG TPA: polysaccharide deacetylase family protein [Usitatibacteraceae bacterium]|nr:polysaccharide deacetylase family protein [Usitatibacteraceae bacterium]
MNVRAILVATLATATTAVAAPCAGTVYLTFDTGNMEPAEAILGVLDRQGVKATFFLANEKTRRGDTSLDPSWAPFWKRVAEAGHAFGSHTWRHWYFAGDTAAGKVRYAMPGSTQGEVLDAQALCAELKKPEEAFRAMTGRGFDGLWRAPGGRFTPMSVEYARRCGYTHAGWTPAGFSGDELPSDRYPGDKLIERQLRDIKDGDILLWHLGIWSRQDPLWPRLDGLIAGLKAKGLCFARLTDDKRWIH